VTTNGDRGRGQDGMAASDWLICLAETYAAWQRAAWRRQHTLLLRSCAGSALLVVRLLAQHIGLSLYCVPGSCAASV